jgi:hypothetical protein
VVASAYQAHRAPLIDEKIPCIPQSTLTRPMGPFDWLSVHIPALDSADAKKKAALNLGNENGFRFSRAWFPTYETGPRLRGKPVAPLVYPAKFYLFNSTFI